MDHIVNMLQL